MLTYNQNSIDAAELLLHSFIMHSSASLLRLLATSIQPNLKEFDHILNNNMSEEEKLNFVIETIIGVTLKEINDIDNNPKPHNLSWKIVLNVLKHFKNERNTVIAELLKTYETYLRQRTHPMFKQFSKQEIKDVFDIFNQLLIENVQ